MWSEHGQKNKELTKFEGRTIEEMSSKVNAWTVEHTVVESFFKSINFALLTFKVVYMSLSSSSSISVCVLFSFEHFLLFVSKRLVVWRTKLTVDQKEPISIESRNIML